MKAAERCHLGAAKRAYWLGIVVAAFGMASGVVGQTGTVAVLPLSGQDAAGGNERNWVGTRKAKPGPWGELEYYPILIEAPMELVKLFPVPSAKTVWQFNGWSRDQIVAALAEAGLTAAQCESILSQGNGIVVVDGATYVFPSAEFVRDLPEETRSRLYRVLRRFEANELYRQPYVIESGDAKSWLSRGGLRDELIEEIARTSYPWGTGKAFSDLPLVLGQVCNQAEQDQLLKTLTRTRSMVVRLKVTAESDLRGLSAYWSASGRRKDLFPILESVVEAPEVDFIDIVHLLPAYARKLLYTFPDPSMMTRGGMPDCHWTSLNFFNYSPMDRLLDYQGAINHLEANFESAKGNLQFGDLLFFIEKGTENAFHSVVYVADDIVFTKNGSNIAMPWIFMRMDDLLARYRQDFEIEIRAFRLKP